MGTHTILLIQKTANSSSRKYFDFDDLAGTLEYLVKQYEHRLKALNPGKQQINYHIQDLKRFIDQHHDMCALVYVLSKRAYEPKDKDWIKDAIHEHLMQIYTSHHEGN